MGRPPPVPMISLTLVIVEPVPSSSYRVGSSGSMLAESGWVAVARSLVTLFSLCQVLVLVPTILLAKQHEKELKLYMGAAFSGIKFARLTGEDDFETSTSLFKDSKKRPHMVGLT
jgi:hypothetical protein